MREYLVLRPGRTAIPVRYLDLSPLFATLVKTPGGILPILELIPSILTSLPHYVLASTLYPRRRKLEHALAEQPAA